MARSRARRSRPTPTRSGTRTPIIYELHVRAFHDSNGDGIGDFRGLTEKLDYLQDLGVTAHLAAALLPLAAAGRRLRHRRLHRRPPGLRHARATSSASCARPTRRGLRVITELVLNHTSDQHPWFQRARRAPPGTPLPRLLRLERHPRAATSDARIIFKDFETSNWTWDPVAQALLLAPLLLPPAGPELRQPGGHAGASSRSSTSGSSMGVDGLRLDAVPYLFEREGTSCENLPETHAFLKELRAPRRPARSATACSWPRPTSGPRTRSPTSATGDECHMAFHFPLMPRLFMAAADGGPLPDHRHPEPDPADPRRRASGRSSCATTTS